MQQLARENTALGAKHSELLVSAEGEKVRHNSLSLLQSFLFFCKYTFDYSVSSRSFCKREHNGLFKILGGAPYSVGM